MTSEKFCLRWNDFEKNISNAFKDLRADKDFFDVTLACEEEQIQAHKVILSACSSFFQDILRRNPHQHPLLYLKGVKYTELQSVLNFMYHGEVNVAQEELDSFLAVAEELQVKGLTQNHSGSNTKKSENQPSQPSQNSLKSPGNSILKETASSSTILRRQLPSIIEKPVGANRYLQEKEIKAAVSVKSEPSEPTTPHYQSVQPAHHPDVSTHPSYDSSYQITTTENQTLNYQDESYEDYSQFDEDQDQGFDGAVRGQEGNGAKVFVTHDKIASYIQEQCLYQTDSSGSKYWSCGVCQKYLNHKRDLMRHIESFHIDTTPYACPHCEAQFNTKRSVQRHTLAVHNTTYNAQ